MNELDTVVNDPGNQPDVADPCAGSRMAFEENQVAGPGFLRLNGLTNGALCRA